MDARGRNIEIQVDARGSKILEHLEMSTVKLLDFSSSSIALVVSKKMALFCNHKNELNHWKYLRKLILITQLVDFGE